MDLAQRDASPNKLRIKQLSEKLGFLQVLSSLRLRMPFDPVAHPSRALCWVHAARTCGACVASSQ